MDTFNKYKKLLMAEMLGTFALVLMGAGAVIMEAHTGMSHMGIPNGKVGLVGIALAHGMTLMAMIYAVGAISGAHFNPAVSVAVWMQKKLSHELLVSYILAQFAGAILAGFLLAALFPDEVSLSSLGTPALALNISALRGIAFEATITFLLVTTILFVTRDDNAESGYFAGLAIGATLTALILFAGPLTGGAANPARYLGPALASGSLTQIPVYFIGPLLGAVMGSIAFSFTMGHNMAQLFSLKESEFTAATPTPAPTTPEPTLNSADTASAKHLFQGHSEDDPLVVLRDVYQILQDGQQVAPGSNGGGLEAAQRACGIKAAQRLTPLLDKFDTLDSQIMNRILAVWMIIEDELGPISMLDSYRSHMDKGKSDTLKTDKNDKIT
jgi:MIP family channel proteins